MVDLHDSLRPTGTVPPLPISEIATRGKRRKRRKLVSTTGLAVATMGIAAFVFSSIPGSQAETVTVADGTTDQTPSSSQTVPDDPKTTAEEAELTTPSSSPSTTVLEGSAIEATAPEEAAPESTGPVTTPGIRTNATTTSEWEDGYCSQIEVIDDRVIDDRVAWQVVLDLDGTIATLWNATVVEASPGTFIFSGREGYNATIQPGTVTSFGLCVDTIAG